MTAPARFRQSDVTRVFRGAAKAGVELSRIVICPVTGQITAFTGAPIVADNDDDGDNEWDVVLER